MATGIDPKDDYVFKRLCGDEDNALVLVHLLNAVLRLPEGQPVRGVTLLNPFVEKDYAEGKVPVLDVRARDDPGRQFLLEMQRNARPGFAKRLLYYWANGHAEQLFKGDRYEMLHPTYVICFVNERLFADEAYHHCFRVYDEAQGVPLCKDLEIHVFELSKFNLTAEEVKTPVEQWCYFFKHGASLDLATLPATLNAPGIRMAMEVLMKLSQDEIERHRAAERRKGERDAADLLATAKLVSREKGREEGRGEGILIGRIQLLQQLLGQPETSLDELSRLSEPELVRLEETLKREWSNKKQANGTPPAAPG